MTNHSGTLGVLSSLGGFLAGLGLHLLNTALGDDHPVVATLSPAFPDGLGRDSGNRVESGVAIATQTTIVYDGRPDKRPSLLESII